MAPPIQDPDEKRKYQREWIARRKAEFYADKTCVDCGSTENLNLDHIDPTKKISHNIWSWSEARRAAELAQCQVLCFLHHRQKTNGWPTVEPPHGSRAKYREGCRCEPCYVANNGPRGGRTPRPFRQLPGGDRGAVERAKLAQLKVAHGVAMYWHGCRCDKCSAIWPGSVYLHDHTDCLICDKLSELSRVAQRRARGVQPLVEGTAPVTRSRPRRAQGSESIS